MSIILKISWKKKEKSQKSVSFSQKSPIFPISLSAKICNWESKCLQQTKLQTNCFQFDQRKNFCCSKSGSYEISFCGIWKKSYYIRLEMRDLVSCPKSSCFKNGVFTSILLFPMEDLVKDQWNFDTKNVRHSITIDRGSNIISLTRLAMAKVLFVSKDFEEPVVLQLICFRRFSFSLSPFLLFH